MRTVILGLTVTVLSGCATSPMPTAQTTPVPSTRIVDNRFLVSEGDQSGLVIIKRDAPRVGLDCDNEVFIDGIKVALIEPAERLELHLALREHIVSIRKPTCGGEVQEYLVAPSADSVKTLRIWSDRRGDLHIQPTAF